MKVYTRFRVFYNNNDNKICQAQIKINEWTHKKVHVKSKRTSEYEDYHCKNKWDLQKKIKSTFVGDRCPRN